MIPNHRGINEMKKLIHKILAHGEHTCPWWICFTFDNPLRKLYQNPFSILSNYVKTGDTVLDIGPGMGYFTFPMAQMAGTGGRVVALDIQQGMLERLGKKIMIRKAENIETRLYDGTRFNLDEKFDFVLLFWMYHEVRNKPEFIREIFPVMKKGAKILIAEPKIHVPGKKFDDSLRLFTSAGFKIVGEPAISLSRAVLLQKI